MEKHINEEDFPIGISFDLVFDFGFNQPTLRDFCQLFRLIPDQQDKEKEDEGSTGNEHGQEMQSSDNPPFNPPEEESGDDSGRSRLQDIDLMYSIIPPIELPCIPIAPPELMLCSQLSIFTEFGLNFDPDIESESFGLRFSLSAQFDIVASMAITLGIPILNTQIIKCVEVLSATLSLLSK